MSQYDFLNTIELSKISKELAGKSLIDIVAEHPLRKRLFIDVTSLHPKANPQYYVALEERLLDRIKMYSSRFSYGSVGPNLFGDAYQSTLDYIELLQSLATKVDADKVEKLQISVIKIFFERIGNYKPFLPSPGTKYFSLWEKAVGKQIPDRFKKENGPAQQHL